MHNFPCGSFPSPTMMLSARICGSTQKASPCVTLRRRWHQKSNSSDWLWPYVALVIWMASTLIFREFFFLFSPSPAAKTTEVLFWSLTSLVQRQQHFNHLYSVITWRLDGNYSLLYCLQGRTKPCLYSSLPLMVYLHSFLLSNRSHFSFMRKGDYLWPAAWISYHLLAECFYERVSSREALSL